MQRFRDENTWDYVVRFIVFTATLLLLSACATPNLDPGFTLKDKATQAVVVMGVKSGDRISVSKGKTEDDKFYFNFYSVPIFSSIPVDGYIVQVVDATSDAERYAITQIEDNPGIAGKTYTPCYTTTPTFDIRPGTVVYLGTYTFDRDADGLGRSVDYDQGSAATFVKTKYPGLADLPLVTDHAVDMPVLGEDCSSPFILGSLKKK